MCSIAFGAKSIPFGTVWQALVDGDGSTDHQIVRELRVPRTLLGLGVGGALGLAGALMQGVTRNPLADPGLLGVDAGAALAVVIGIHTFGVTSLTGYVWFAFVGRRAGQRRRLPARLGRAGRRHAGEAGAGRRRAHRAAHIADLGGPAARRADARRVPVLGGRARSPDATPRWSPRSPRSSLVGAVLALASSRALNTLSLGDDVARSLGQRVHLTRGLSALSIVLLCGAATAAAGPIGFVGLTVPHVARAICGPDYRWILPWSLVLAPTLLLTRRRHRAPDRPAGRGAGGHRHRVHRRAVLHRPRAPPEAGRPVIAVAHRAPDGALVLRSLAARPVGPRRRSDRSSSRRCSSPWRWSCSPGRWPSASSRSRSATWCRPSPAGASPTPTSWSAPCACPGAWPRCWWARRSACRARSSSASPATRWPAPTSSASPPAPRPARC